MFMLILVGADPIVSGLPPVVSAAIASLSVLRHFENITRGVIDLRDAVYFAALAALFLALAYYAVMRRKLALHGAARRRLRMGTVLLAGIVVVVNLLGRNLGGRLDLTPGKAYTLAPATRALLGGLDDLLTIKLFVSEELPPEIGVVQRDIGDLLADFRSAGKGKVRVVEIDPAANPEALDEARALGIAPVQFNVIGESELQVKEGFLGIAVQYADGVERVPFVQRTEDLEYRLVAFVRALTRTTRPVVGLVEATGGPAPGPVFGQLRRGLEENYEVRSLSLTDSTAIADEISALVLLGAAPLLSDTQATRFGEFLERGRGALVVASGMELQQQSFMASARPVGWNRLLEPYGVSIRLDMAFDLASNERVSVPIPGGRLLLAYPFFVQALSTRRASMNRDVDALLLPWTSSIDTSRAAAGTVTPLLTTSRAGGIETGRAFIAPQREFTPESLSTRLLAVAVNPLAADAGDSLLRGRLVVVGSEEFVTDRYAGSMSPGLVFALNAVDWLAQDEALIRIRSKDRRPPPLVFESQTTRDVVKYGNVAGVPFVLVVFATVRLWRRRRRSGDVYRPEATGAVG